MVQPFRQRKAFRAGNRRVSQERRGRPHVERLESRWLLTAPTISEFPIATSVVMGINSIARSADGRIWFTEAQANAILRRESDGSLSVFPVPTPKSGLSTIAAARNGDLWFTETAANQVGCITPGGEITEYAIPTPLSGPVGIAQALDEPLVTHRRHARQF